jgi:hypothetical protein
LPAQILGAESALTQLLYSQMIIRNRRVIDAAAPRLALHPAAELQRSAGMFEPPAGGSPGNHLNSKRHGPFPFIAGTK